MEVNAKTLADCFGITQRAVRELAEDGVTVKIRRGVYDLGASVQNYIEYKNRPGRSSSKLKFEDVRAEHEAVKMQKTKLTVARMQGSMHAAADVERLWTNMAATVKTRLLGIPVKLAPQLCGLEDTAAIRELLQKEVTDALNEVSGYDPADYDSYDPEEEDDVEDEETKTE